MVLTCFAAAACLISGPRPHRLGPQRPQSELSARSQCICDLATPGAAELPIVTIENVQVGDRVSGRNPIREQAETIEPDPATW